MTASVQQRKMFFGLANTLGYDPERVKERAKKRYNLESFRDATKEQLQFLIDRLLMKQKEKELIAENL